MSAGHTPGPWWVTNGGVRDSGGLICSSIKAFHYPGQDARFEIEVTERSANSRLIAAAPDLLEALQCLLACVNVRIDDPRTAAFDAARTAIAKATGGTP